MNLLSKTLFLALTLLIAQPSFSVTVASPAVTPADVWTYSFSPGSMSFSAVAGSVAPAPQNLEVKYAGDCGGCPPSVNATVPWIVVGKPTWSGFNVNYAISIKTTGLAAGTYTGKINGSSPVETPTSFTIPVTLTVTAAAVTPAHVSTYSLSPFSMSFSGAAGSVAPAPQNLDVKYAGPCDHCPPSVHATVPWIVVGKATASGYSILFAISTNTTGLAAGTYTGKINGSSPDETPTAFTIPVTLTITAAAVTPAHVSTYSLSPFSMSFSGAAGSVAPAPQNLDVNYAGPCDHCPPNVHATVPWIVVGKANGVGLQHSLRHIDKHDWVGSRNLHGEDQRLLARRNPDRLHCSGHLNSHSRKGVPGFTDMGRIEVAGDFWLSRLAFADLRKRFRGDRGNYFRTFVRGFDCGHREDVLLLRDHIRARLPVKADLWRESTLK